MGSTDAHSQGNNHWRWLSDTLRDTLTIAALKQPGLSAQQRETLDQVLTYRTVRSAKRPKARPRRRCLSSTLQ